MSAPTITVYQKPTCTTCKQVYAVLKEAGVDFEAVDYYLDPIPKATLRRLLEKMQARPRDILRAKEPVYASLGLGGSAHSDEELLDLMVQHPDLIQRPIVEKGDRAILARPADRIKELLSS